MEMTAAGRVVTCVAAARLVAGGVLALGAGAGRSHAAANATVNPHNFANPCRIDVPKSPFRQVYHCPMTRVAPIPPAESDLLCEFCGYTLNGLSRESNCPECGMRIAASADSTRQPPLWERKRWSFIATTIQIIFRPTAFFRAMTARGDLRRAARFGHTHWIIASILFGITGSTHASLFYMSGLWTARVFSRAGGALLLAIVSYLALWATTWLAVRLTAWEANYRGIRLPLPVVMRCMYYHAAHYLPVGAAAAAIVLTYSTLYESRLLDVQTLTPYLYAICAAVIVAAVYLFNTYWIGMRNLMYANR
jgi:hypothetical protein